MMFLIISRGSADTSVPGVPQLPEDGEGDGRPNVDVKADRRSSIPDDVDRVSVLKAKEGPDLSHAWAEEGEVRRGLKR